MYWPDGNISYETFNNDENFIKNRYALNEDQDSAMASTICLKDAKNLSNNWNIDLYLSADNDYIGILKLWALQRSINVEFVEQLANKLVDQYKKSGFISFTDMIHLAFYKEEYYIIDGQHRLIAYAKVINDESIDIEINDFYFPIIITRCQTETDMMAVFEKVNTRNPVQLQALQQKKIDDLKELLTKHFTSKMKKEELKAVGVSSNVFMKNRPFINEKKFVDKLRTNKFFLENDLESILAEIIRINRYIKSKPLQLRGLQEDRVIDVQSNIHAKCAAMKMYLGYYKNLDWIDYMGKNYIF